MTTAEKDGKEPSATEGTIYTLAATFDAATVDDATNTTASTGRPRNQGRSEGHGCGTSCGPMGLGQARSNRSGR